MRTKSAGRQPDVVGATLHGQSSRGGGVDSIVNDICVTTLCILNALGQIAYAREALLLLGDPGFDAWCEFGRLTWYTWLQARRERLKPGQCKVQTAMVQ